MQTLSKNDPKSIGPFTLVARLGAGGMGIVYLATRGTQSVALKVLNSATMENPLARSRFKKEIQTLRQIESPFVAKVIDSYADEETAWLAVEFINGPDLKALVEDRGPLPLDQWITLAHGLLNGLQAIHAVGVIHRDIKPGNILISESGPKIIDFGISQDLDATSLTTTGLMAGSPAWLSPEQIDGAKLTSATDLFSAGSVLHFAASGISPWGNQNTSTTSVVFNNILSKAPNTSKIPEPQRGLIEVLLEKESKSRPSATKALKILDSFGEGVPKTQIVSSTKISKPERATRKSAVFSKKILETKVTPRRASAAFAVGALLVALVFVTPALLNQPPEFVCAETYYEFGDISGATFSTLEEKAFSNSLSRDCQPYSNPSIDPDFSYEHCFARDPFSVSSAGGVFEYLIYSQGQEAKSTAKFEQSKSSDYMGRFGCRSHVQFGLFSGGESRLNSLGFQFTSEVPLLQEEGRMEAGESRYVVTADGMGGTFVTRFYSTNQREGEYDLAIPAFSKIELERIEYKSGRLDGLEEGETGGALVFNMWNTSGGVLSAELTFCFEPSWGESLRASGQTPKLEAFVDGAWVPSGEVSWGGTFCASGSTEFQGEIPENEFLSMEPGGTCNPVRFDIPGTSISSRDLYEFCFYVNHS